jgi:hypothetical protein
MTAFPGSRHALIEQHLHRAQRCNALAARLYRDGDDEGAERQRQLLAVLLHNALMQLPPNGHQDDDEAQAAAWPSDIGLHGAVSLAGAREPLRTASRTWDARTPAAGALRRLP